MGGDGGAGEKTEEEGENVYKMRAHPREKKKGET